MNTQSDMPASGHNAQSVTDKSPTQEPKTFYMVYCEGKSAPVVKQESYNDAVAEAERIAKKEFKTTYVLEAILSIEACVRTSYVSLKMS